MSDINRVSSEIKEFEALASKLEAGDLDLGEIREIEDHAFFRITDEKTQKIGERVLISAAKKREGLADRQIQQLGTDPGSKIQRLYLSMVSSKELEDPEEEIALVHREITLEEDPVVKETALKQLEDLEFATQEPIVHEFDRNAVESTFSSRMGYISKMILDTNSPSALQHLNKTQILEIERYARRGS